MRSRDGSSSLTFTICAIIFFSFSSYASEYLISYRSVVKDAYLYNEDIIFSKTMQPCKGEIQEARIFENPQHLSLKKFLSYNNFQLIEYLQHLGLVVQHKELKTTYLHSSITILTLPTTCFKVEFNEDFVTIAPIK